MAPASFRGHQQIQGFRRGDEEMKWAPQHRRPLRGGRVTGPNGHPDVGGGEPQLCGHLADLPERRLEVLVDVDRQGLQGGDVDDLGSVQETDTRLVGSVQPVDADQERRERFA
jgi:hypothetical protein